LINFVTPVDETTEIFCMTVQILYVTLTLIPFSPRSLILMNFCIPVDKTTELFCMTVEIKIWQKAIFPYYKTCAKIRQG
jgi:hypothetical protein